MDGLGKGTRNQRESSWETVTVYVEVAEMSREKMSVLKRIPYPSRETPLPHTHLCFLWGDFLIFQFLPFCCWYCPIVISFQQSSNTFTVNKLRSQEAPVYPQDKVITWVLDMCWALRIYDEQEFTVSWVRKAFNCSSHKKLIHSIVLSGVKDKCRPKRRPR